MSVGNDNMGSSSLHLNLRTRVEPFKGSDIWDEVTIEKTFPAAQTALLLCDVWDKHWCEGATRRVDEMAPKMNAVVAAARDKGVQIIHAPSDTMDFYIDNPQRRQTLAIPSVAPPEPVAIPDTAPLPIDDSDGGCDTSETPWYKAWKRQHPAIEIMDGDAVSDDGGEIYSLMHARGIKNLLIMGVHTNMCVLKRSFGIKQMTRWSIRCVLVRDLTDAMYNPAKPPYVSHQAGTELVIQYIEKCWCPSILSSDLVK